MDQILIRTDIRELINFHETNIIPITLVMENYNIPELPKNLCSTHFPSFSADLILLIIKCTQIISLLILSVSRL